MKITVCGSIAFIDQMLECQTVLEKSGHIVYIPSFTAEDPEGNPMDKKEFYRIRKEGKMDLKWFEKEKARAIREHFDEIVKGDAILVTNYEKNGVPGYIGGNTLMEMGLAFHFKKPIYLLYPLPEISYKEEIIGMLPIVLDGDLSNISE